jgi:hypothetical protein
MNNSFITWFVPSDDSTHEVGSAIVKSLEHFKGSIISTKCSSVICVKGNMENQPESMCIVDEETFKQNEEYFRTLKRHFHAVPMKPNEKDIQELRGAIADFIKRYEVVQIGGVQ